MTGGLRFALTRLAAICVGLLWLSVVSELAFAGRAYLMLDFLSDVDSGALTDADLNAAADAVDQVTLVVSIGYTLVFLLTVAFCSVWIYRASWNAQQIQPDAKRVTPGWAIGWFFIPIMALWKPYAAMVQCLNSSVNPAGSIDSPAPGFVKAWWVLWVIINIGGNLSFRLSGKAETAADYRLVSQVDLALAPLSIIAALLFIRVIKTITSAQQGRYPAQAIEETFA